MIDHPETTPSRIIYELMGGFVIAENGVWLPGSYATHEAAARAFDLPDDQLQALQDAANERAGGVGGVITAEDLPYV